MIMVLHYLSLGFAAGFARKNIFTKEFMEANFGEEHRKATGSEIQAGGLPDHGSGRYTMKAGYKAWMEFNTAQRAHYNYLENFTQVVAMMLMAGIYWPVPTAILGGIYTLGRIIYSVGYKLCGPKGRVPGALIVLLMQFCLPIYTIVSLSYLW